jgi:putative resolvase
MKLSEWARANHIHDQRADLDRQVARLSQWAATAGWTVIGVEAEVASGMDGKRPKLCRLLADPSVAAVVEHRARLARINAELVEAGRRPVVLEEGEVDLVGDVVEVLPGYALGCTATGRPATGR